MIGELLKKTRQEQSLTQKQLAAKSGISFVSINRIENGNHQDYPLLRRFFQLWESESQSTLQIILKWSVSALWLTIAFAILFPIILAGIYFKLEDWYNKIHY